MSTSKKNSFRQSSHSSLSSRQLLVLHTALGNPLIGCALYEETCAHKAIRGMDAKLIKCIVVEDIGVGKTSLIRNLRQGMEPEDIGYGPATAKTCAAYLMVFDTFGKPTVIFLHTLLLCTGKRFVLPSWKPNHTFSLKVIPRMNSSKHNF